MFLDVFANTVAQQPKNSFVHGRVDEELLVKEHNHVLN